MSLRFFAVVVFAFLAQLSSGQKLKPGYIVTQQSDTVHGFLKEGTDSELIGRILFSTKAHSDSLKPYVPQQLKGFGFQYGRTFKSVKIPDIKTREDDSLFYFVKKVISGHIDVYDLAKKEGKSDFFLVNNVSHDFVVLRNPRDSTVTRADGSTFVARDRDYVRKLNRIKKSVDSEKRLGSEFNFTQSGIKSHIIAFNKKHPFGYPVKEYRQHHSQSYEFSYGWMPNNNEIQAQNVSFFWHTHFPERNRRLSVIKGLMYTTWSKDNKVIARGSQAAKDNSLTILPIGVHLHTDTNEKVGFYCYLAGGFGFAKTTSDVYENFQKVDKEQRSENFLTLKVGAGFRLRLGKTALLTEVSPLGKDGIFLRFGVGF